LMLSEFSLAVVAHANSRGFILREFSPSNLVVGTDNRVYMIDVGMAKLFVDPLTNVHIPSRE
ncbi:hypothetical protein B0H13DRAFT_1540514, partial [Mycena leptocephala]